MRGILDPAASAVNKNNNQKNDRARHSLQPLVFGFRLLVDGDVGVGVFPAGEEVVVSPKRPYAGDTMIAAPSVWLFRR